MIRSVAQADHPRSRDAARRDRIGEAHGVRDPVITAGEGRDGAWHRGTKAIPECGDRRHPNDVRLAAVGGDRCEIRQHPIIGNESECLGHVTSAVPAVRPDESPTQRRGDQPWLGTCPLRQRCLGVHAAQAARNQDVDQGFEQLGRRSSTGNGPGRMRGQRTGPRLEHLCERAVGPTPRNGGQGMNGRDAGHGVEIVSDDGHQVTDDGSSHGRGLDAGLHLGHGERSDPDRLEDGARSGNPLESDP